MTKKPQFPPFHYHRFENGIQLAAETFDTVQSVSIGFFFKSGVVSENIKTLGVSHFIEHMLFKGTPKRSAKDIARQFDRIGGYLNAFTAKDYCCFYARVVKDKLSVAVEILTDMLKNSLFDETELERERGVILEEIKMYEDSPDEIIHELLGQSLMENSPLGRPILGTFKTISQLPRTDIVGTYNKHYVSSNMMICTAGNLDWNNLIHLIEKNLHDFRPGSFNPKKISTPYCFQANVYTKKIEQVHVAIGFPGVSYQSHDRYPLTIINAAFGGGMSSRLFQEIREKKGLAYSVYSYHTAFKDSGIFSIYAGTSVEHFPKVLRLISKEIERISNTGLSKTEINETKEQLKGNLLIALESTTNRMNRMVTGFLYDVQPLDAEASIQPFMEVSAKEISSLSSKIFDINKMSLSVISPSEKACETLKNSPFGHLPISIRNFDSGKLNI
ncbi:MAG: insulinase family protein [Candidatus Riflebacteria bacterium]|nr:insulinase family protein [Candidatus Riflebacteria bacterium]